MNKYDIYPYISVVEVKIEYQYFRWIVSVPNYFLMPNVQRWATCEWGHVIWIKSVSWNHGLENSNISNLGLAWRTSGYVGQVGQPDGNISVTSGHLMIRLSVPYHLANWCRTYGEIHMHVSANIVWGQSLASNNAMRITGWSNCVMMTSSNGNIFRVTGHLCGEFTGPRWIPRTKASDAELWCFLWSASE